MSLFQYIKHPKGRRLLSYIWSRRGKAVRNDIIRDLHLSHATVINEVDELLRRGILVERDALPTRKGRQPKPLMIHDSQCFGLGIFIWQQGAEIMALNAGLNIIASRQVLDLPLDGMSQLHLLLKSVMDFLAEHALDRSKLIGLGVSLPGMIDHRTGIVRRSACFLNGAEAPIIPFWKEQLGVPCLLLERTAALAFLEKEWGAAAEMRNFLYFDGAGVGMFLNDRIYLGSQSYGGEIGMMKISDTPAGEIDGRYGTLNVLTRFRDLRMRAEQAVKGGAESILTAWQREGKIFSRESIYEAACRGDLLGRGLVEDVFAIYAEMIVNLNYLFNPEAIFLWPWTARCPGITLDVVQRRLNLCKLANPDIRTVVLPAQCGEETLARGAAILPLNNFFNQDFTFT